MSDPLFTDLIRDTERLTWKPAEEVRELGRRRTRRTRIGTGLAAFVAVVAVAGGAVGLNGRPDASRPPILPATESPAPSVPPPSAAPASTPSSSPSSSSPSSAPSVNRPESIPAAAMLQTADLPSGFRAAGTDLDGDWSLEAVTIFCEKPGPAITPGEVARRGAVFRTGSGSEGISVIQRVTRHSGGNAAAAMDKTRNLVTGCRMVRAGDSLTILATGLGGDESLLAGAEIERRRGQWLLVREGDLVSQLWLPQDTTEAEAREYAARVAERLGG